MNPIADCQFRTPDESAAACIALWEPLRPYFSEGRGRVSLGRTAAHFRVAAAELEGFSRPLFGLAPLCAGGRDFEGRPYFLEGLANGADPDHPDFWGWPDDYDQRLVESAAIGFTLALAPEAFFEPLPAKARVNLGNWLKFCQGRKVHPNNWHFFHVLGSLGLDRIGVRHDPEVRENALRTLEGFYQEDGWYSDGRNRHFDHYIGFAMHFYGLVYAVLNPQDADRAARFRERAALFAGQFRHWTDDEGASLAYGRSMTYRFAQASFWAGLAYAGIEAPGGHGVSRRLWASNMRWWARRDWFDRDGVMPVGYGYPNLLMSESYNSPGSPYWAMKAFLPLALSGDHAFWSEPEKDFERPPVVRLSVPGMLIMSEKGNSTALSSGSENCHPHRGVPEKYAKFAYSTAYGFSVDPESGGFDVCSFDNMLSFSDNGRQFYPRVGNIDARISDDCLWARWSPCADVEVETWLIPRNPWHLRLHRIVSGRPMKTIEGGFAVPRDDDPPAVAEAGEGLARVLAGGHAAVACDLDVEGASRRTGVLRQPLPNSSLYFPQTHVPQLHIDIEAGETWLAGAFLGSPNGFSDPPAAPAREELSALLAGTIRVKGLKFGETRR
ncbi:MAG: DUF2264 domain-containing protein [Geminicoccaceae bacterium]|nr:DUF2264 domain-containing protein [Geminicoccaceae bacterium]